MFDQKDIVSFGDDTKVVRFNKHLANMINDVEICTVSQI
jgi:hypothetical protein